MTAFVLSILDAGWGVFFSSLRQSVSPFRRLLKQLSSAAETLGGSTSSDSFKLDESKCGGIDIASNSNEELDAPLARVNHAPPTQVMSFRIERNVMRWIFALLPSTAATPSSIPARALALHFATFALKKVKLSAAQIA